MTVLQASWTRPHGLGTIATVALGTPLIVGAALLAPEHPDIALTIGAVALCLALLLRCAPLLVVAAVPAVWVGEIVRLLHGALSVADAFLIVAAVAALTRVDMGVRRLRVALLLVAGFQAVQVLALAHLFTAFAAQEWAHRLLLVGGGLLIGAALVRTGRLRLALQLFIGGGVAIAAVSAVLAIATHFAAAYPLLNKNYAGDLLASAVLVVLLVPREVLSLGRWKGLIAIVLIAGLIATQSRGAMLATGFGLVVYALCKHRFDGWNLLLLLGSGVAVAFLAVVFGGQAQIEQAQHYGALLYREQYVQEAVSVWQLSPFIGMGIRFWESGLYTLQGDPHNLIVYTLAESGLIGLVSLLGLLGGVAVILLRWRGPLAALAVALLASRGLHGLFDVYWVHGSLAIPWVIAGAALVLPRVGGRSVHSAENRGGVPETRQLSAAAV